MKTKKQTKKHNILRITLTICLLIIISACSSSDTTQVNEENQNQYINPHAHHNHAQIYSEEMFLIEMIPHHREAVDTALIMLNSESEFVKKLSQDIIVAQEKEIDMMSEWINTDFPNSNYKATYVNMMRPLSENPSTQRDIQFLEDMVAHHEAAVMMADQVLTIFTISQKTRELAQNIIITQSDEIEMMRREINRLKQ
jgi:uncharacterized protein (DUF305 family)